MTRIITPIGRKLFATAYNNTDVVIDEQDMQPVKANNTEDVKILGAWEDYTGSDSTPTNLQRGQENKLQGTIAQLDGAEPVHDVTIHGNTKSTHRTRAKLTTVYVKK